jgi:guanylate cyclase 2D/E/F
VNFILSKISKTCFNIHTYIYLYIQTPTRITTPKKRARNVACEKCSVACKKRIATGEKRIVTGEKRIVACKKRSVAGKKRIVTGEKRNVACKKRSVACKKRSVAGKKRASVWETCKKRVRHKFISKHLWCLITRQVRDLRYNIVQLCRMIY